MARLPACARPLWKGWPAWHPTLSLRSGHCLNAHVPLLTCLLGSSRLLHTTEVRFVPLAVRSLVPLASHLCSGISLCSATLC